MVTHCPSTRAKVMMTTRLGWTGIMIVTGSIPSFNLEALINHHEGSLINTLGTVLVGWAALHLLIESPEFESIEKRLFPVTIFLENYALNRTGVFRLL